MDIPTNAPSGANGAGNRGRGAGNAGVGAKKAFAKAMQQEGAKPRADGETKARGEGRAGGTGASSDTGTGEQRVTGAGARHSRQGGGGRNGEPGGKRPAHYYTLSNGRGDGAGSESAQRESGAQVEAAFSGDNPDKSGAEGERQALAVLRRYHDELSGADDQISRAELQKYVDNGYPEGVSDKAKEAVAFLLDHNNVFERLQGAVANDSDEGIYSREDLDARLNKLPVPHERQALALLRRYHDELSGADDQISRAELQKYVDNGYPEGVSDRAKEAVAFLLDNNGVFERLQGAVANDSDEGIYSREDLDARLAELPSEGGGSAERTALINFAKYWDELSVGGQHVDVEKLKAAANNQDNDQALRDTAQYLLDNRDAFLTLETAKNGGDGDGIVSAHDVYASLEQAGLTEGDNAIADAALAPLARALPIYATERENLTNVAEYWDELSGDDDQASRKELKAAANNQDNDQALRDTAQYLLDNRPAFLALETASSKGDGDGIVRARDVYARLEQAGLFSGENRITAEALAPLVKDLSFEDGERAGLKALAQNWDTLSAGDGLVSVQDLRNQGFSDLAEYFEQNPVRLAALREQSSAGGSKAAIAAEDLFGALQQAGLFSGANRITAKALAPFAKELSFDDRARAQLKTVSENWAELSGDDNSVSLKELDDIAKNSEDADLAAAAKILRDNPDFRTLLAALAPDNASADSLSAAALYAGLDKAGLTEGDNAIADAALAPLARALPIYATERENLTNVAEYWDELSGDDDQASRKELKAAANNQDNDQALRDTAQYLLDNRPAFLALETASSEGDGDGIVRARDVYARLEQAGLFSGENRITAEALAPLAKDLSFDDGERAGLKTLAENWAALSGDDDSVSLEELDNIANNADDAELAAAAEYLRDHPERRTLLAALAPDSASADSLSAEALYAGLQQAGLFEGDNAISEQAFRPLAQALGLEDGERAGLKTLAQNWDTLSAGDGLVSVQDLRNQGFSELADYFEQNPGRLAALRAQSSAGGSKAAIAAEDLNAALKQAKLFEGDNAISEQEFRRLARALGFEDGERAGLKALAANWGELAGANGEISWQALTEAVDSADPELAKAAEYLTTNYDRLQALRSLADAGSPNAIAAEDLYAALQQAGLISGATAISDAELAPLARALPIDEEQKSALIEVAESWDELSGDSEGVPLEQLKQLDELKYGRAAKLALDTASQRGSGDGRVSEADLRTRLDRAGLNDQPIIAPKAAIDSESRALAILVASWDEVSDENGNLRIDTFKAIAGDNPTGSPSAELRGAVQYYLDRPSEFQALATAAKGSNDAWVGSEDIAAQARSLEISDEERASLIALAKHWDAIRGGDQQIDRQGLDQAAADGSNPELQSAAKYFLNNRAARLALDTASGRGSGDDVFKVSDLYQRLGQAGAYAKRFGSIIIDSEQGALDVIFRHWDEIGGDDGGLSTDAFKAIAGDEPPAYASNELKAAVQYYRDRPDKLDAITTAAEDSSDGSVARSDLAARARVLEIGGSQISALKTLAEHWDELRGDSEYVYWGDLKEAAEEANYGADNPTEEEALGNAAEYFLRHGAARLALDTAGAGFSGDEYYSAADLYYRLTQAGFREKAVTELGVPDEQAALDILAGKWRELSDKHGHIKKDRFKDIAQYGSVEVKAAVQYYLAHPDKLSALDDSGDKNDSRIKDVNIGDRFAKLDIGAEHRAALIEIAGNWGELAGDDGTLHWHDLKAAASDEANPIALRDAARYFVQHEAAYMALDTAKDSRGFDEVDDLIALRDLQQRLRDAGAYDEQFGDVEIESEREALRLAIETDPDLQSLRREADANGDKLQGENIDAYRGRLSEQTIAYIHYLRENPDVRQNLSDAVDDPGNKGQPTAADFAARARALPIDDAEREALSTLAEYWDELRGGNRWVSKEELANIASGRTKADQELRDAARYFVDNPVAFLALETQINQTVNDNTASTAGLMSRLEQAGIYEKRFGEISIASERQALGVLLANWSSIAGGENSEINTDTLRSIVSDDPPNFATQEIRAAAYYYLGNDEALAALDTKGIDNSGEAKNIGKASLIARSGELDPGTGEREALRIIEANWDLFAPSGSALTRDNLRTVRDDSAMGESIRSAARYLLEDPVAFAALRTAEPGGESGHSSNAASEEDLDARLATLGQ